MAKVYIDTLTDNVYVDFGDGVYTKVGPDGDPVTDVHHLPGAASPMVNEEEIVETDTSEAYDEGYRTGYDEGESEGYDAGLSDGESNASEYDEEDMDSARNAGYDEGHSDGYREGYNDGLTDGRNGNPE